MFRGPKPQNLCRGIRSTDMAEPTPAAKAKPLSPRGGGGGWFKTFFRTKSSSSLNGEEETAPSNGKPPLYKQDSISSSSSSSSQNKDITGTSASRFRTGGLSSKASSCLVVLMCGRKAGGERLQRLSCFCARAACFPKMLLLRWRCVAHHKTPPRMYIHLLYQSRSTHSFVT